MKLTNLKLKKLRSSCHEADEDHKADEAEKLINL